MKPRNVHILTIMVDSEFGVITRITAQIRREGWSIKSLAVSEPDDVNDLSRMTLALGCFDTSLPDVVHRISRLACVRSVTAFDAETHVCQESLLVRVPISAIPKLKVRLNDYEVRKLSETAEEAVYSYTDTPETLDAFVAELNEICEVDIARTGAITIEKTTKR